VPKTSLFQWGPLIGTRDNQHDTGNRGAAGGHRLGHICGRGGGHATPGPAPRDCQPRRAPHPADTYADTYIVPAVIANAGDSAGWRYVNSSPPTSTTITRAGPMRARELAWVLEHSGASASVTLNAFRGRRFLDALRGLCPELDGSATGALTSALLPSLHTVVTVEGSPSSAIFSLPQFLARGANVDPAALAGAQQAVPPEDICYILYTSGSTAAPKGVTLAHGPLIANGFDIGERQHLRTSDRLWLAVPLFWSFGSANAVPAITTHGGCVVLQ